MTSYLKYRQRLIHALDANNDEDITWITVRGRHIPIKEGQSKGEAIKEAFNKSGEKSHKSGGEKSAKKYTHEEEKKSVGKSGVTKSFHDAAKERLNIIKELRNKPEGRERWRLEQRKKTLETQMEKEFKRSDKFKNEIDKEKWLKEIKGNKAWERLLAKTDKKAYAQLQSMKGEKKGGESKSEGAKKEFMSKEEYGKVLKNVQPILKKAVKSEPKITKDLQSIEGIKLVGLDYRLKKEKSAVEKVKRERIEKGAELDGVSDKEIMGNMWDLVRYTQQVEKGSFVEQAQKTLDTLKKKGYKIHQLKNFWRPEVNKGTNPYRGINVKLLSPDGQKVELQFNTENNMKVKERMHEIYNKQRELKPDSKEYQALNKESLKLTKEFDNPKGIEKLVG